MTLPSFVDSDPDPSAQLPWPRKSRARDQQAVPPDLSQIEDSTPGPDQSGNNNSDSSDPVKRRLSTWNLITLSIAMGGAQVAWTVELGYGVPFS